VTITSQRRFVPDPRSIPVDFSRTIPRIRNVRWLSFGYFYPSGLLIAKALEFSELLGGRHHFAVNDGRSRVDMPDMAAILRKRLVQSWPLRVNTFCERKIVISELLADAVGPPRVK
jgi:hypothetical protein